LEKKGEGRKKYQGEKGRGKVRGKTRRGVIEIRDKRKRKSLNAWKGGGEGERIVRGACGKKR
jgi:hypothetical protein